MEQALEAMEIGVGIFAFIGAILLGSLLLREGDRMEQKLEDYLQEDRVIEQEDSLQINDWLAYE